MPFQFIITRQNVPCYFKASDPIFWEGDTAPPQTSPSVGEVPHVTPRRIRRVDPRASALACQLKNPRSATDRLGVITG